MAKKPNIKKLHYPMWLTLVFFLLTILAPIVLILMEGLKAPDTPSGIAFKVSSTIISICIIVWFFVEKTIISRIETKLLAQQVSLEHDYAIEVGNPNKIKYLWYSNQLKLSLFDFITMSLYGGAITLILLGVASALMSIKATVLIVVALFVLAYSIKFMWLISRRDYDE